ncbi:MAG: IPTL-CTERM sorting domain-containing protein, partial [Planctomycetes bacterium]|nr:IPTL-CTERM sorting domain-containing protein [Planctomycetota bacterium]
ISTTTATGNGNITDLGVPNPTQHGVCWSTSENPTTADSKTEGGAVSATGSFASSITGLTAGTTYYVRAYATNRLGTVYGSDVNFTTDDGDGVTAGEESGPDGNDSSYSGNDDAIPDSIQSFVASMHTNDGNNYVTLSCPDNQSLAGVTALANPHPADSPAHVNFPFQFFEFTIIGVGNGNATTLTIDLPAGSTAAETYWKYGPTPTNNSPHWYEFMYDGTTGAVITSNQIVLHFVDGQRGDDVLTEDGMLVDQGGPGIGTVQVPTLNEWGMIIMGLLLLGSSFWILKRKEQNSL